MFKANQHSDIVAFTLDRQGRLVGRIENPAATLDQEELRASLLLLARECDRLEYFADGEGPSVSVGCATIISFRRKQ